MAKKTKGVTIEDVWRELDKLKDDCYQVAVAIKERGSVNNLLEKLAKSLAELGFGVEQKSASNVRVKTDYTLMRFITFEDLDRAANRFLKEHDIIDVRPFDHSKCDLTSSCDGTIGYMIVYREYEEDEK